MASRPHRALPQLTALVLRVGEREALARSLAKENLAAADIDAPGRLFWRFETPERIPVGFGGLEAHGPDALLRSVLTLPPARNRGIGHAIVGALEIEAMTAKCRTAWLITESAENFFARLGYAAVARATVPPAIQATEQFSTLCPNTATVMAKPLR